MKNKGTKPINRQLRTRKDILQAAARLIKTEDILTIDKVAKEALVSRATAYRYFSDINRLLSEVVIDQTILDAEEIFKQKNFNSLKERIDYAESIMHDFIYENEYQLRVLLSRSIFNPSTHKSKEKTPVRQNRRIQYINESLSPYRKKLGAKTAQKLSEALALVFGPEAMIVFRDVMPIADKRAREIKSWIISTLTDAALRESRMIAKKS